MTFLSLLLLYKIIGTLLAVGLPMLLFRLETLNRLFGAETNSVLIYRLYGIAVTALCVGYGFGIPVAEAGQLPLGIITMGLVSNGGAVLILMLHRKNLLQWIMTFYLTTTVIGLIVAVFHPSLML